jgi:hypothetical protein
MTLDVGHQTGLIKLHKLIRIHIHCGGSVKSGMSLLVGVSVESMIRVKMKVIPRFRFD